MPLAYCQLHHIAWWQRDNGATNQANCAAYCSYHHHQIHRLGIVITRRADGTLEHRHPDGRIYGGMSAAPPDQANEQLSSSAPPAPAMAAPRPSGFDESSAAVSGAPAPSGSTAVVEPPPDLLHLLSA
jgi:hypothetical protein